MDWAGVWVFLPFSARLRVLDDQNGVALVKCSVKRLQHSQFGEFDRFLCKGPNHNCVGEIWLSYGT